MKNYKNRRWTICKRIKCIHLKKRFLRDRKKLKLNRNNKKVKKVQEFEVPDFIKY